LGNGEMSRKNSDTTQIKIIDLLATHQDFPQYQMEKATNLTYKTIIENLKLLEQKKYVKVIRTEPSKKGGKEKKFFSITLEGLIFFLYSSAHSLTEKDFDSIATVHPDLLPLIFGKWSFFAVHNLKHQLIENIKDFLENDYLPAPQYFDKPITKEKTKTEIDSYFEKQLASIREKQKILKDIAKESTQELLYAYVLLPSKDLEAFISAYKHDKDLKEYTDRMLNYRKKYFESCLKTAQHWLNYWNKINE